MEQSSITPQIVIVPTPSEANLNPLIELAKLLVHRHSCAVTFLIPQYDAPSDERRSLFGSLSPRITHVFLPAVSLDDLPPESTCIETIISLTLARSLPSLHDELRRLVDSTRPIVLIGDLFSTAAFDVAKEFNIAPYIFFPSTGTGLSKFLNHPIYGVRIDCDYMPEPHGFITFHGRKVLDPVQDHRNGGYNWVLHHAKQYKEAKGILLNSFQELEPGTIEYLRDEKRGKPPVYPVGPLVSMEQSSRSNGSKDLKWLDRQPKCSVLYVSFGSAPALSREQIQELALGLEKSEQRFFWVVRSPDDNATNASHFAEYGRNEQLKFLPAGFLERTRGRGLVMPSWVPQAQVLAHSSIGGFFTHCGWNSTLESVVNGVPLMVWPLYETQEMNAYLLTEHIKVALRVRTDKKTGLVGRDHIAGVAKELMEGLEGKSVRKHMKRLKDAASIALSEDGCSSKALSDLAHEWAAKSITS